MSGGGDKKKPPDAPEPFVPPSGGFDLRPAISLPPPRTISTQSMPAVRAALANQPPAIVVRGEDGRIVEPVPLPRADSVPPRGESISPPSLRPPPATTKSRWLLAAAAAASGAALLVIGFAVGRRSGERRAVLPPPGGFVFEDALDVASFQRGNVHTHTTRSDGHQEPEEVAAWYRDHGYQFLVLSDHDVLVDPDTLSGVEAPGFVLLPGEEISSTGASKPVHVQALCIGQQIPSGRFDDARAALADAVTAVRAQGGVPVVNHPNFQWSLTTADLASVAGDHGLEIWSGNPDTKTAGDAAHPAAEAQWDEMLARGRRVTGYAVDDMHTLVGPESPSVNGMPGRGWVETFGDETSRAAICDALAKGRLFASSGLRFRRIAVGGGTLTVWVDDPRTEVNFIGSGGTMLARVDAASAPTDGALRAVRYTLRGGELYVRARATLRDVGSAWTQAYRVAR